MTQEIGTARIRLTMDATDFTAVVARSKSELQGFGHEAERAFNESNSKAKSAATSLARYIEMIGKSADEVKLLRAQWAGVDTRILTEMVTKLDHVRASEAAVSNASREMADSWTQMQGKARNAFKELQSAAREEQMLRDANAAKRLAEAAELAGIKAQHAAQGLAFLAQQQDAQRVQRMQQAVSVFGASLEQLESREFGASNAAKQFTRTVQEQEAAIIRGGHALQKGAIQFNQYGISAKQQVAAMRQVPAQLTDIFVSLQGGQNPLTVLLQQGGQLKDIFGGIVPAARALGGAIMGLVTPWTLLAAAIGAVGLAYLQAEQRENKFNKALIMSGQSASISAEQMQAMASSLDQVSGITSRQAADALTQVAATGKIAADQMLLVGEAATQMQNVTGKAISDTVAEYAELARDPTSAILKFNEAENFLTASIYERIRALQESGQIEEAAALATETRANAQIERTGQVVQSLGLVSGAWHEVKRETAEAWDEAVDYFANLDKDAAEAASTLGKLWNSFKIGGPAGMFAASQSLSSSGGGGAVEQRAAEAQKKINSEAQRQLDSIIAGNRTKEQQQELEITRIRNLGKAAGKTAQEIKVLEDASRKAYEASLPKGRTKKGDGGLANAEASAQLQAIKDDLAVEQNAIQNSNKLLQAQYSARIVVAEEYYRQQRALVQQGLQVEETALLKQIDVLKSRDVAGKDSVNTLKQLHQVEAQLAKVRADGAVQLQILTIQEKDAVDDRRRAVESYRSALERSNEAAAQSVEAALARITLGEREAAQQEKIAQILEDGANKQRELAQQFAETNDVDMYNEKLAALESYVDEQVRIAEDGYARMAQAQASWLNGVEGGVNQWIEKTSDVASQTNAITQRALDGSAEALTTWATTGKLVFKDLLIDIGKELVKFFMKRAVMQFLMAFAGGGMGGASYDGSAATGGAGSWAGATFHAKGNAISNSPDLSQYSGSVVSQPTYFRAFAKGGNVMGEAGHEGIFPLARDSSGDLGVKMIGAAGGGVVMNLNMVINNDGTSSSNSSSSGETNAAYKQLLQEVGGVVDQKISRATQPGGVLWKQHGAGR